MSTKVLVGRTHPWNVLWYGALAQQHTLRSEPRNRIAFSCWEEGEDLSLLDFKAIEYKRKGNAVADDEQLARIADVPKREFMRRGINQHTLEKICKREPVRAIKVAKCLRVLEQYELEMLPARPAHERTSK